MIFKDSLMMTESLVKIGTLKNGTAFQMPDVADGDEFIHPVVKCREVIGGFEYVVALANQFTQFNVKRFSPEQMVRVVKPRIGGVKHYFPDGGYFFKMPDGSTWRPGVSDFDEESAARGKNGLWRQG